MRLAACVGVTCSQSMVTVRRITGPADVALPGLIEIYRASIPASERKPDAWLAAAAGHGCFELFSVELSGETVVGLAVVYRPAEVPFALLEYLAIAPGARGGGAGAAAMVELLAVFPDRCVLAEIDAPRDADGVRRVRFYRRLGFAEVAGLDYQLPLLNDPPPMRLFVARPPAPLGREMLQDWLRRIYVDVYGISENDPRPAAMVGGLSDPLELLD